MKADIKLYELYLSVMLNIKLHLLKVDFFPTSLELDRLVKRLESDLAADQTDPASFDADMYYTVSSSPVISCIIT